MSFLFVRNTLYKIIYDAKKPKKPTNDLSYREKGVISAIASGFATLVSHPFETKMVREIGDLGRAASFQRPHLEENLYAGLGANLLKTMIYNGIIIWPYDVIKEKAYGTFGDVWTNKFIALFAATWVGLGSIFILDVIKTRQMFSLPDPSLNRLNYSNAIDVVVKSLKHEGPYTFLAGFYPHFLKLYLYSACVR